MNSGFIQVLRLLEDVGLPELVIQLASLAITEATNDVNSQVTSFVWCVFTFRQGAVYA